MKSTLACILEVVDEWAHHRGFGQVNGQSVGWWRLTPFPLICDIREASLSSWDEVRRDRVRRRQRRRAQPAASWTIEPSGTTTGSNTVGALVWRNTQS